MRHSLLAAVCVTTATAAPQTALSQIETPSARAAVSAFAAGTDYPSHAQPAADWVARTIAMPEAYAAARTDSILDGLRDLAADPPNEAVGLRAINWLASAGTGRYSSPIQDVARRIVYVYSNTTNPAVRLMAVRQAPSQVERGVIVPSLERVASEDSPLDIGSDEPASYAAVEGLTALGAEGEAALRRLYESGTASNPLARGRLAAIARNDFKGGPGSQR